ncbi:multidrug effflux MFS transporter [Microtetraspora fusca]|uniref:multidrug effflux MFS transporter n=1 Tax=Microtetraspora fusca TaxID=1997 RepID=UPI000836BCBE|nr:multidrug effflux MFS transporter [Microtetraspora fusca]
MSASPGIPPGHEGSRVRPALLLALALLSAVAPLATDMYLPAFTSMAADLGTDAAALQLTLTAFLAGLGVGQLIVGPLSDRLGRRSPLLVAAGVCTAASVLCALAPNVWVLVACRAVQGLAGSAGIVIGRAVISDTARGVAAARAFSTLVAIGGIAPVVAPLAGGALLGPVGWRGILWVLAGTSVAMFLAALFFVPETLRPEHRHAGGLGATGRAARVVLADRAYLGYTLAYALGFGALMGYISASPFVVQNVLGMSTAAYSAIFAMNALGMVAASAANARLVGRFKSRTLLRTAQSAVAVLTAALLVLAVTGRLVPAVGLPLLFLAVALLSPVMSNASALAIGRAPQSAGIAGAVMGALQFGAGAAVSPLVGLGGAHTAVPMTVVMTVSALLSAACVAAVRNVPGVPERRPEAALAEG